MNKRKLIAAIIEKLRGDLALHHKAAGAARAEATDEQSKAENKYDTRGLEASYLARGQSRQAAELGEAIKAFENLVGKDFVPVDGAAVGAAVKLQSGQEVSNYFIGPRGGGTEVTYENEDVLVITPETPLGSQLLGRKAGEKCLLNVGGQKQVFEVLAVS